MLTTARRLLPLLFLPLLIGCERVADLLELPDPQREAEIAEAEGRAIGGACRHAGRSLEDCYALNTGAVKSAVFAGWREMNDYMMEHKIEEVPSRLIGTAPTRVAPASDLPPIVPGEAFNPIQPPTGR